MKNYVNEVSKWIKNQVENSTTKGAIVGLSGGIDSSVVATLCVNALGKENVFGMILPCNSPTKDFEDAMLMAQLLDIKIQIVNIEDAFNNLKNSIFLRQLKVPNKLAEANMKARLRMTILYAMANQLNYLVVGTGNRSELEIGYYTKYGDGGVDIEPLNDFYKTEVYEMARELNIPQVIIDRKPSAGLWQDQTDEDEIGCSYEMLDLYLKGNLVKEMSEDQMHRINYLILSTEHKRKMPPMYEKKFQCIKKNN